jgi:hypothetical protein
MLKTAAAVALVLLLIALIALALVGAWAAMWS